ncbi:hypothetical protein HY500_03975 [Candidatus Woesearchaeota archaeon]|nr:hypothetical protein [Candidatus Woesearchaeota archaeon]
MKKSFLLILAVLVLVLPVFSQEEIQVVREVQESAREGDIVNVQINIFNPYPEERVLSIEEKLPNDIQMIEPSEPHETRFFNGIKASFLRWEKTIGPKSVSSFNYRMKLLSSGYYSLSPTKVIDVKTTTKIQGTPVSILVTCVSDKVCGKNENYMNCRQDCKPDAEDGVCNPDPSLCDPDCEGGEKCDKGGIDISIWYIIIPISLIGIAFFVFKFKKDNGSGIKPSQLPSEESSEETLYS